MPLIFSRTPWVKRTRWVAYQTSHMIWVLEVRFRPGMLSPWPVLDDHSSQWKVDGALKVMIIQFAGSLGSMVVAQWISERGQSGFACLNFQIFPYKWHYLERRAPKIDPISFLRFKLYCYKVGWRNYLVVRWNNKIYVSSTLNIDSCVYPVYSGLPMPTIDELVKLLFI